MTRWTCRETFILAMVILIGIAIVGLVYVSTALPNVYLRTGVYAYCQASDKASDCEAWRDNAMNQHAVLIQQCQNTHDYPLHRDAFFSCLADKGL